MKRVLIAMIIAASTFGSAQASNETHDFGVCLTDSITGKERKLLAKWMFISLSSHSTLRPLANISQNEIDNSNKFAGQLVTRLVGEDCPEQARAALEAHGSQAFEQAFSNLGQIAVQELTTEQGVVAAMSEFEKYIDREKFNSVFQ